MDTQGAGAGVSTAHDEFARTIAGDLVTASDAARAAFGQATLGVLGHRSSTVADLDAALEADPELTAAWLLKGFGLRSLGRRDLRPAMLDILGRANSLIAQRGGRRERALADGLEAWMGGRAAQAAARLEQELEHNPTDVLLMKLVHAIRFTIGDTAGMLACAERAVAALPDSSIANGFARGCLSFALVESGRSAHAKEEGARALAINSQDAWALHAVAHVLYEDGDTEEGIAWLTARVRQLDGLNNFAGHIAWHEALFHLESGQANRALELFDHRVAIYPPNDYRDVSNASTLLLLLEDHGVDVGDRWLALADIARARLGDHGLAFADIHYVLSLAGAGCAEEAFAFVVSMQDAARRRHEDDRDALVTVDVGAPVAEAIVHARNGDVDRASTIVHQVHDELPRIGGSRAQRRVVPWVLRAAEHRNVRAAHGMLEHRQ